MKRYCVMFIVFTFLFSFCKVLAFENNIVGNARVAGMGFTQAAYTGKASTFFANPANIGKEKISLTATRLDLFGTGMFYELCETSLKITPRWEVGVAYELVHDKDIIDNSGYEQRFATFRLANQINAKLQLGMNFKTQQYRFFEERIGSGNAIDFGIQVGPFYAADRKIFLGLKIEDMVAFRNYVSQRRETPKPKWLFGGSLVHGDLIYAIDLRDKDLRMGLEYQVASTLALRAGLADGQSTLGFGIKNGRLQIDYAYWIAEVNATHCVSSCVAF